ncbi:MAG TPA: amidohydrolase/deacetylase family metallohydrolase [Bryobacteraceae bacterium]|jgi:dihydroorotase
MKTLAYLFTLGVAVAALAAAQPQYDLLIKGGHLIDPKNNIDAVRDVAIKAGKIAAVAPSIPSAQASRTIDARGLYVTPGIVDMHVHVYAGTGERGSYAGDLSVYPDGFTFRNGVTTVVDAGCSGWRNFEDFEDRVIKRSRTRVLAMLNIVGSGMRGGKFENNLEDMEAKPTAEMALKHPDIVVGVKCAHYSGPEWAPYERAVEAGTIAKIPVMIDFGANRKERPIYDLTTKILRPGDIYTHVYSGLRNEQNPDTLGPSAALIEGRKRGIIFDVGHGNGSFLWRVAVPLVKAGFLPDSISTDLHVSSMNTSMKGMLNVMSKMLAIGVPLDKVIAESTWNPAKEIQRQELGQLSVGAIADIAVLRVETGKFGFVDHFGARLDGTKRLLAELTLKDGRVMYDLNGLSRDRWDTLPKNYGNQGNPLWDGYARPAAPRPKPKGN